ncbi:MAG: amidase [Solirubrobacteraceae bacterium]|nr:amidase [Solirubrobacteraceae bacterium]
MSPLAPGAVRRVDAPLQGLLEQRDALADGQVTSEGLVREALARAERSRETLNAFWSLRKEEAILEAREADSRLRDGDRLPLLGVPIAVKDDVDVAGLPTQFGAAGTWPSRDEDAGVVRRRRAAGAIVIGKTTASEMGQWPVTANDVCGVTRNAWDLDFTPGGSSGGSGAAVAAGILAAAVGSDGAGSVRIPSAWSHLVGIKPQRGRISTWPHDDDWRGLSVIGPLARTVEDAALMLDVMTGAHASDRIQLDAPDQPFLEAARRAPGRLRIGVSRSIAFNGMRRKVDPDVSAALDAMARTLRDLGHEVVDANLRFGPQVGASFMPRAMVGLEDWMRRAPDRKLVDPRIRSMARMAHVLRGPILAGTRRTERLLQRQVGRIFRRVDVVITPTTAVPPLPAEALKGLRKWQTNSLITSACPYAWPWNVLGWPAVNVPGGFSEENLPLGIQLLGPANSEALLISLAAQLQQVRRWHEIWPDLAYELAGGS